MSTAGPIPVMVRRFECPWCKRRRASKAATAEHIGRCWLNPANRACKTCQHHDLDNGEWEVGIPSSETCDVRDDVQPDQFPVSHCTLWELREKPTAS